jgi:hypothetical protein
MDKFGRCSAKRVDFHIHAKPSKRLPFSLDTFWWTVSQARQTGLDAFVLTEHFHAPDFWSIYDLLCQRLAYEDGILLVDDQLHILTGAELGVAEGCDILLVGTLDQLGRFSQGLAASPVTGYKPPFVEALEVGRRHGLLMIGAHMYRCGKELARLGLANLRRLDALELNGKDFFHDSAVRAEAARLHLPVIGGSDAHVWLQVGIKATVMPVREVTPRTVARALVIGETDVRSLPYGPMAVQMSGAFKRMLKARVAQAA